MNNLSVRVSRFCQNFLKRTVYGECKGFCPFHGNPFKCSDTYIKEHPEEIEKILLQYEEWRADDATD